MSAAALVLAAAIAAHAPEQGFSVEALAIGAATATPDPAQARERAAATDRLRARFVLDPGAAWRSLSGDERERLRLAWGPGDPATGAALVWFMRGAIVRVAGEDLSGLHNPLADVWLVLRWRTVGGGLRLSDAFLVPGDQFRPDGMPGWPQRSEPYAAALAAASAEAAVGFVSLPDRLSSDALVDAIAGQRETLRAQALATIRPWLGSLRRWGPGWAALRARLVATDAGDPALSSLPQLVRATMAPAGSIERPDGVSLLVVSPLYPSLFAALEWPDSAATGTPTIRLLDLGARSAAGASGGSQ